MNRKKAIKIIKSQQSKLNDPIFKNDGIWISQTTSFIEDIFGPESTEYKYIRAFSFGIIVPTTTPQSEVKKLLDEKVRNVSVFLDSCIETLNIKGIRNILSTNFLSNWNNATIIGTLVTVSIALVSVGFYFGTEKIIEIILDLRMRMINLFQQILIY